MFDVGFSELMMVGLVALLVIGPEKLPKAARIAGFWLGKARSTVAHVKTELKQELYAEEMRQLLHQHSLTEELQQAKAESAAAIQDINSAITAIAETKPTQHDDPTT
jgi:sec-independent protein translocase protein TatB